MYASDSSVRDGFSRAKQDIESLRKENQELRAMIEELREGLHGQPEAQEPVRPSISSDVTSIPTGDIKAVLKEVLAEMAAYQEKRSILQTTASDESLSRFDLDKKAVIKAKIIDAVAHAPMVLSRLKELVVDQNKYCSKASFYRYFEELKDEEKVSIVTTNGRNVVRANQIEVYSA